MGLYHENRPHFQWSCMDVRVGLWRKLSAKELMLLNCGEKTLESPLDCKEIKPVNSKGDQSWIFIGRTDAEAPILWPPHAKSWLTGKDPDAGRNWGQEEKGTAEDEMAGWHHQLDAHEFGWTAGVGDRQGGLACCDSWGHKEADTTGRLNWLTDWPSQMCSKRVFIALCLPVRYTSYFITHTRCTNSSYAT